MSHPALLGWMGGWVGRWKVVGGWAGGGRGRHTSSGAVRVRGQACRAPQGAGHTSTPPPLPATTARGPIARPAHPRTPRAPPMQAKRTQRGSQRRH